MKGASSLFSNKGVAEVLMQLNSCKAIVRRKEMKRQSIILLVVFVVVGAGASAVIWTQVAPEYRAKGEVRVRPIIPHLVFQTEDSGMIPLYRSFLNTQVAIVRSPTVLQRVLDQQEVQDTQWFKKRQRSLGQRLRGKPIAPLERLRDALFVGPRPDSEIIEVAFADSIANDATIIVNAVLEQYVRYVGEMADATEGKLYRQLVDQYKLLENEIQGRQKITAELRKSLGTEDPQELISSKRLYLDDTQARLSELRRNIAVLESQRKELEDSMKREISEDGQDAATGWADGTESQQRYYEDAEWRERDVAVRVRRHEIAVSEFEPNDPGMIRAEKDLQFAEELLRLRESQLDKQWRDGVRSELVRAREEEKLLHAEFEKQQAELERLFETAQLLEKENNALEHKRQLFTAVRQRLDQKAMERNVPGAIEVLTFAAEPSRPDKDRRMAYTGIALLAGLGMSGGAALMSSRRKKAVGN